jgi:hypothetical protein
VTHVKGNKLWLRHIAINTDQQINTIGCHCRSHQNRYDLSNQSRRIGV